MTQQMQPITVEQLEDADADEVWSADVLIGVPAIAAYMGLRPRVVERLICRHGLPAFRLGEQDRGPWLLHTFSIDAWLLDQRQLQRRR